MTTTTPRIPALSVREAPVFDAKKPLGLQQYFEEQEFLIDGHNILNAKDRKKYVTIYLKANDALVFKSPASFLNKTRCYEQWKDNVCKFFPGSSNKQYCTLADLRRLVEQTQTRLVTQLDLGNFIDSLLPNQIGQSRRIAFPRSNKDNYSWKLCC